MTIHSSISACPPSKSQRTSDAFPNCNFTVAVELVFILRTAVTVLVRFSGAFASSTATKFKPSNEPSALLSVVKVISFALRPISFKPLLMVALTGIIAVLPKGIVTMGCSKEISSGIAMLIVCSPTTFPL